MADNDSTDESPPRGTAARGPTLAGDAPSRDDDIGAPIITIEAPDGTVRDYELTDDVRSHYEDYVDSVFDRHDVNWYETWWEGTELCIEYHGFVRDSDCRPDTGDDRQHSSPLAAMMGGKGGIGFTVRGNAGSSAKDYIPGKRSQPWAPRKRTKQARLNVEDLDDKNRDYERFDQGLLPVWKQARLDIQERANYNPLSVEDLFVKPWSDEKGHKPIETDYEAEEEDPLFEVDDYRDFTDDTDTTVSDGARGDRWGM